MIASGPPETRDVEDAILLVVSGGLSDFIENTLASIERCRTTKCTVCIALPRSALTEVRAAVSRRWSNVEYLLLDDLCHADCSWMQEYHDIGTEGFGRFTTSKWAAIRFLLQSGFRRVTYTDIDVAWMRDPMPLIRASLKAYEMAMQTEGRSIFPPYYCTGFMSFRNSELTTKLLQLLEDTHLEIVKTEPKMHDQVLFYRTIANSKGVINRIFPLSEQLFANGVMAGAMISRDDQLEKMLMGQVEPMIFHANCTIGLENKRRLLQRTGNWLIGESARVVHRL